MKKTARPYQTKALDAIRGHFRDGKRRIVLVSPTGAGKTFMASQIIDGAVAKGNRVLFLAHRKELIDQCSATLDEIGVDHGVIKSGHWRRRPKLPVQVASIQTLVSKRSCPACKDVVKARVHPLPPCGRCEGVRKIPKPMPAVQILVIDETHRCLSPSYQEVVRAYPDALILGLTATPWRLDRKGLGRMYEAMVETVQVQELVDEGFLLPIRAYAPDLPDLSNVKTTRGDYDQDAVSVIMGNDQLVGNIIEHWKRLGEGRRTVVFASSVENSLHLTSRFKEAGIAAEHLDGSTPDAQRDAILQRLADGTTRVVCNVNVLVEGYDLPSLGCVVLAQPTKSLTRYLQQVGRGMRPHEDQEYMILLDHSGCVHEHGLPTDPRRWSLEDRQKKMRGDGSAPDSVLVRCDSCGALRLKSVAQCPGCSSVQTVMFRIKAESDEELVEFKGGYQCEHCESYDVRLSPFNDLKLKINCRECGKTSFAVDRQAAKQASEPRQRQEFERLRKVQMAKGFKDGWVSYKYREIFGRWPPREWRMRDGPDRSPRS